MKKKYSLLMKHNSDVFISSEQRFTVVKDKGIKFELNGQVAGNYNKMQRMNLPLQIFSYTKNYF